MRSTAHFLSVVFHPLLMPTLLFAVLFFVFPEYTFQALPLRLLMLAFIFIATYILPLFVVILLLKTGAIDSLEMSNRKERPLPLFITGTIYFVTSYLFYQQSHVAMLYPFAIAIMGVAVVTVGIITLFWKISAHAVGVSGMLGMIIAMSIGDINLYSLIAILASMILAGSVMTARLYLGAHTTQQIYVGATLGFLLSFLSTVFIL